MQILFILHDAKCFREELENMILSLRLWFGEAGGPDSDYLQMILIFRRCFGPVRFCMNLALATGVGRDLGADSIHLYFILFFGCD